MSANFGHVHRVQDKGKLAFAGHLVRRFVGFVTAAPLTPSEQQLIAGALEPALRRAFFSQRSADQRHAFDVWQRVDGDLDLAAPALLHDIGKVASDLGALSRSTATVLHSLRLPLTRHWRRYLAHGEIGADRLEELGASDLAVHFARNHPSDPPTGVNSESWCRLERADEI